MALSTAALADMLKEYGEPIYIVGDGYAVAHKALAAKGVTLENTPPLLIPENAYSCARCAVKKYERGEATDDLAIAPTYLRMPQAERERLEREKQEKEG